MHQEAMDHELVGGSIWVVIIYVAFDLRKGGGVTRRKRTTL